MLSPSRWTYVGVNLVVVKWGKDIILLQHSYMSPQTEILQFLKILFSFLRTYFLGNNINHLCLLFCIRFLFEKENT